MFPYDKYRGTPLWEKLDRIVADLEDNRDIEITTGREYIIGYLCRQLSEDNPHELYFIPPKQDQDPAA